MEESNKRIAKNTVYLYIRMFVQMILGLVSTRIVLDKLGASDYGLYVLVGGFVSMFAVLNSILQSGTSRFIALYQGKGVFEEQKKCFTTSMAIHFIVGVIVVMLLESIGLWYLNSKINIEPNRMYAANWVFQFSVLTVFLTITQTPYTASVTAHEKFDVYAIMSLYDVVAKILILYLLVCISGDKLIIYGALVLLVSITSLIAYRFYCTKKFEECVFSFAIEKCIFKQMLSFSGWTTLGHLVMSLNSQGYRLIINRFYDTVMNAAGGLASTVSTIISQFIAGFIIAAQPQLVKYYGAGDMKSFFRLINNVSQYTLFLLALIVVPVLLEIDYVIGVWLGGNVPDYTVAFVRIGMLCNVIYRSSAMIDQGLTASNHVKELNSYSIPVYFISLPLVYVVLWNGWGPLAACVMMNVAPLLTFLINLYIIKKKLGFESLHYFVNIFLKNLIFILVAYLLAYFVQLQMEQGLLRFFVVCTISELLIISILWFFGMNAEVKDMVLQKIKQRFHK